MKKKKTSNTFHILDNNPNNIENHGDSSNNDYFNYSNNDIEDDNGKNEFDSFSNSLDKFACTYDDQNNNDVNISNKAISQGWKNNNSVTDDINYTRPVRNSKFTESTNSNNSQLGTEIIHKKKSPLSFNNELSIMRSKATELNLDTVSVKRLRSNFRYPSLNDNMIAPIHQTSNTKLSIPMIASIAKSNTNRSKQISPSNINIPNDFYTPNDNSSKISIREDLSKEFGADRQIQRRVIESNEPIGSNPFFDNIDPHDDCINNISQKIPSTVISTNRSGGINVKRNFGTIAWNGTITSQPEFIRHSRLPLPEENSVTSTFDDAFF